MGYTHYWTQRRSFAAGEWDQVTEGLRALLKHAQHEAGVSLGNGLGDGGTSPEFFPTGLSFNGIGDDSHETFGVDRARPKREPWQSVAGGGFCKTARKPYDIAVTAALCYLATVSETHGVWSDGKGRDFLAGLEMARAALPRYANVLDIPRGVMEDDRWVGPYVHHFSKGYEFRFCVDGRAYIMRLKDGASYCFPTHREAAAWAQERRDVLDASGFFDAKRRNRLQVQQSRMLAEMVNLAPSFERDQRPPAFVRPNEFPEPATRAYRFADLLAMAEG